MYVRVNQDDINHNRCILLRDPSVRLFLHYEYKVNLKRFVIKSDGYIYSCKTMCCIIQVTFRDSCFVDK